MPFLQILQQALRVGWGTGVGCGEYVSVGVGGIGIGVGGIGVTVGINQPFSIPSAPIVLTASTVIPHRRAISSQTSSYPIPLFCASTQSRKIIFRTDSTKIVSVSGVEVGAEVGVARGFGVLVGIGVDVGTGVAVALQATSTNPKSNKPNLFTMFSLSSSSHLTTDGLPSLPLKSGFW